MGRKGKVSGMGMGMKCMAMHMGRPRGHEQVKSKKKKKLGKKEGRAENTYITKSAKKLPSIALPFKVHNSHLGDLFIH